MLKLHVALILVLVSKLSFGQLDMAFDASKDINYADIFETNAIFYLKIDTTLVNGRVVQYNKKGQVKRFINMTDGKSEQLSWTVLNKQEQKSKGSLIGTVLTGAAVLAGSLTSESSNNDSRVYNGRDDNDIDYAVVYKDMSERNDILQALTVQNTQNKTNSEKFRKRIIYRSKGDSINGKKEGEWQTYYNNGTIKNKGIYLNDHKIGVWSVYYDTGELEKEILYKLGKKHGRTKIFYKNGAKKALLNYNEGKENGISEYFDQDGHLQMKVHYKSGKEDGALEYYDKGELVHIEFWQNGVLVDKKQD